MKRKSWPGKRQTALFAIASFIAVTAVLGILVYRQWDALATYQWQIDWNAIFLAFVCLLVALAFAALAWAKIMRTLGSNLPDVLHFRYYVISHLARRLPGTIWYVAGRGYLYRQHGASVRLVTLASGLEYVLLTLAGAMASLALWISVLRGLSIVNLGALVAMVVVGAIAVHPVSIRWYFRRAGLNDAPQVAYHHILFWLVIYIGVWLSGGAMFFALAYAIAGVDPSYFSYVVGCWCLVGTLSVVVFFLPSNFGFTEIGLSLLLSAIMPSSLAVVVALLSRVFGIAFELAAAAIVLGLFAITNRFRPQNVESPAPSGDATNALQYTMEASETAPIDASFRKSPEVEDKIPPTAY